MYVLSRIYFFAVTILSFPVTRLLVTSLRIRTFYVTSSQVLLSVTLLQDATYYVDNLSFGSDSRRSEVFSFIKGYEGCTDRREKIGIFSFLTLQLY